MEKLAIFGGEKTIKTENKEMFLWPIVTREDEDAVLDVLRNRSMSGFDITQKFENEYSKWLGVKYALGFNNGTASIHAAMYGAGVSRGDEVICPSITYWASCAQVFSLGGTVVFADVDPETLCIDPDDFESKITSKTKAVIVVHYCSYPCDMDRIMAIAKKYKIKVIEDVSHAQGGLYKGKKLGTFGDVAAMSLMTGKSLAIGEAGILVTDDREIYERAVSMGAYERFTKDNIETEYLKPYVGLPLGGYKYRMHQMSSAVGLVQLKYYDERCAEIRKAINYFWDLISDIPCIKPHRVDESDGSNMAGYYLPMALYYEEKLGGLSITRFCEALRAEGVMGCYAGINAALHTHPLFKTADVYNDGKPTRIAFSDKDVREFDNNLSVSEMTGKRALRTPYFKHFDKDIIEQYAKAFKKVVVNYESLLEGDNGNPENIGLWNFFNSKTK